MNLAIEVLLLYAMPVSNIAGNNKSLIFHVTVCGERPSSVCEAVKDLSTAKIAPSHAIEGLMMLLDTGASENCMY